jgi:hypothetical protein
MTSASLSITPISTAWNLLHAALTDRHPVQGHYSDHLRVFCPHILGWKNGRAKVLAYQIAVLDPHHHDPVGWRSFFVDQLSNLHLTTNPWLSGPHYNPLTGGIDTICAAIGLQA